MLLSLLLLFFLIIIIIVIIVIIIIIFIGRTVERRLGYYANYCREQGVKICEESDILFVYDNCPMDTGYFFAPTREVGSEVANTTQAICTALMAVHIIEAPGVINLQNDFQYSPKNDLPLLDSNGDLLAVVPTDLYKPRLLNQDENEYNTKVNIIIISIVK